MLKVIKNQILCCYSCVQTYFVIIATAGKEKCLITDVQSQQLFV